MKKCAVCHKPVTSGVVVHSECMELLQKTQQVDDKPMTNGDRIRAMTDEELAEFLNKCQSYDDAFPVELWKNWLTWPVEVE